MIRFAHKGNFRKTEKYLKRLSNGEHFKALEAMAILGVRALSEATPKDTGKTSESWGYQVDHNGDVYTITWTNSNINDGVNVAIILQYDHGTGSGGFVEGIDYINPAIRPVFDKIQKAVWEEVSRV